MAVEKVFILLRSISLGIDLIKAKKKQAKKTKIVKHTPSAKIKKSKPTSKVKPEKKKEPFFNEFKMSLAISKRMVEKLDVPQIEEVR